jgi:hypothetical protein
MQVTQQLAGREACRKRRVSKTVGLDVSVDKAEVVKSVEVLANPKTLRRYRTVVGHHLQLLGKDEPSLARELHAVADLKSPARLHHILRRAVEHLQPVRHRRTARPACRR